MGPPIFIGGNAAESAGRWRRQMLQWGHRFSSVEMTAMKLQMIGDDALQWGHRFSSVEIWNAEWADARAQQLQWGHRFSSVEISTVRAGAGH